MVIDDTGCLLGAWLEATDIPGSSLMLVLGGKGNSVGAEE